MTKEQRDKICITCKNKIMDERYGMLCGITNNLANFQESCKDYSKTITSHLLFNQPSQQFKTIKREKSKGIGSLVGKGIAAIILFKIVIFIIKMIVSNN